jgi:RecG-like helicase
MKNNVKEDHMELKYFVIILSFSSIIFLYFLSTLSQPTIIDICEIPSYEGKKVIVKGIVTEHRITTYGGQIIKIKNLNIENHTSTLIFVEEETSIEYGDKIQAMGVVQKYNNDWEIVVKSKKFITILKKWNSSTFPLWQLAENPNNYLDINVNITGFIDRIYDSYFYLIDAENLYTIAVYYDSTKFYNFSEGDRVYIGARFVYNPETLRFVLTAEEKTHFIDVVGSN